MKRLISMCIGVKMIFANFFQNKGVEVYKRLVENGTENDEIWRN